MVKPINEKNVVRKQVEDRNQKERNAGLMEAWSHAQYAGEGERVRAKTHRKKTIFQKLTQIFTTIYMCVCSMHTFIQVLTRTDRSTIVLQCSLRAPTLTPKYIPCGISFLASSVLCVEPAYPIGPNRLGPRLLQPIRPMLSLYLNTFPMVHAPNKSSVVFVETLIFHPCLVLISHFPFVERQAQHQQNRLKKPRTGSVGTDR